MRCCNYFRKSPNLVCEKLTMFLIEIENKHFKGIIILSNHKMFRIILFHKELTAWRKIPVLISLTTISGSSEKLHLICSNVRKSVQKLIHQHLILIYENSNTNFSNLKCKSKIAMESLSLITISCKSMEIPLHAEYWSSPFAILCRILIRAVVIMLTVNYFSCCFFDTFCVKGKAIVSTNDKCPNSGPGYCHFQSRANFRHFHYISHSPCFLGRGFVAFFEIMYYLNSQKQ